MNDAKRFKLDYWTNFVEYASGNAEYKKLFVKNKPMAEHWYPVSMGSSEYHMSFGIKTAAERTFIEIYIKDNKELFRTFFSHRQEIEKELGVQLNWLELPRKIASRIVLECPAQVKDKEHWQEQFEWFVQMGNKFYKTFKKYA